MFHSYLFIDFYLKTKVSGKNLEESDNLILDNDNQSGNTFDKEMIGVAIKT